MKKTLKALLLISSCVGVLGISHESVASFTDPSQPPRVSKGVLTNVQADRIDQTFNEGPKGGNSSASNVIHVNYMTPPGPVPQGGLKSLPIEERTEIKDLRKIREIRRYINYGSLEITQDNFQEIYQIAQREEASFNAYSGGIVIKEWHDISIIDQLNDVFMYFASITSFSLEHHSHQQEGNMLKEMSHSFQDFNALQELHIENCKVKDDHLFSLMKTVRKGNLTKNLSLLNVKGTLITLSMIDHITNYFQGKEIRIEHDLDQKISSEQTLIDDGDLRILSGGSLKGKTIEELVSEAECGNEDSLSALENLGENGDVSACMALISFYKEGEIVDQSDERVFYFASKAAKSQHKEAQFEVAECYRVGKGVTQDDKLANRYYKFASKQGHVRAQAILEGSLERERASMEAEANKKRQEEATRLFQERQRIEREVKQKADLERQALEQERQKIENDKKALAESEKKRRQEMKLVSPRNDSNDDASIFMIKDDAWADRGDSHTRHDDVRNDIQPKFSFNFVKPIFMHEWHSTSR